MFKRRKVKKKIIFRRCPFCLDGTEPDYKAFEALKGFLTERGKIVDRTKTGVCAKHQRRLATHIKRARHLSLLPFVVKPL